MLVVRDFALLALLLLAAYGAGHLVLRPINWPFLMGERLFFTLVLGLGSLCLTFLLLGIVGLLYSWVAWSVIGLGLLSTATGLCAKKIAGWFSLRHRKSLSSLLVWDWFQVLLIAIVSGTFAFVLLAHALMPPHEWDEIAYHMAVPKLYIQQHQVVYIPYIVHSNWPFNIEMLFTFALLLGSDVLPHLMILSMAVLTAWGIGLFARRFFDRRVGWLAAALYISAPLVRRLAGTGLIDIGLTCFAFAAVYAFALYLNSRGEIALWLAAAYAGFAAGSKLMGAGIPLALSGILLIEEWHQKRSLKAVLGVLIRFVGVAFLLVLPWYIKSYLHTGNPVWPFLYKWLGGRSWDLLGDEYHMHWLTYYNMRITLIDFLLAPWRLVRNPARFGGYTGGFGLLIPALVSLALIILHRVRGMMGYLLAISGIFFALWFTLVGHQIRFLLPVLPPLCLTAGGAFYWLSDRLPRALRVGAVLVVAYFLATDFPLVEPGHRHMLQHRLPYALRLHSHEALLVEQIDAMEVFQYANNYLPDDALILLLPYEDRGYYLDRTYIWGNPISQRLIPLERFDRPDELACELRRLGITHILENPHWIFSDLRHWEHDRQLMLDLEAQYATPIFTAGGVSLLRLSPVSCQPMF